MGISFLYRLDQLIDNVLWRSLIGISHSKIYDILSTRSCVLLQFIGDTEDIRRQALNARKVVHGFVLQRGVTSENAFYDKLDVSATKHASYGSPGRIPLTLLAGSQNIENSRHFQRRTISHEHGAILKPQRWCTRHAHHFAEPVLGRNGIRADPSFEI